MRYCYRCPACGTRSEHVIRDEVLLCGPCIKDRGQTVELLRDYRAENVGLGSGVKVSRDGTNRDQASLFLPDNKDFKGPGDPDGTKGMKDWHEQFEPRSDNPAPMVPGRIERTVF